MGRFHRHADGTEHEHDHDGPHEHVPAHSHEHVLDLTGLSATERAPEEIAASPYGDLSGYATGGERVDVLEAIFDENDAVAFRNRAALDAAGVRSINLMSSPGSGKTALIAATLPALTRELAVGIVVGDIATDLDAVRLRGLGAEVALLNTANGYGGECHLDAPMVAAGLADLDLDRLDLLIVENVGNLVCPAEFETGTHRKAMLWSVTEGEDKPLKYPVMFSVADLVVISKVDLVPHLDVDLDAFLANLREVNPVAEVIAVSARTGEGMADWLAWLSATARERRAGCGRTHKPDGYARREHG